jgi:hypothetical protein
MMNSMMGNFSGMFGAKKEGGEAPKSWSNTFRQSWKKDTLKKKVMDMAFHYLSAT